MEVTFNRDKEKLVDDPEADKLLSLDNRKP